MYITLIILFHSENPHTRWILREDKKRLTFNILDHLVIFCEDNITHRMAHKIRTFVIRNQDWKFLLNLLILCQI